MVLSRHQSLYLSKLIRPCSHSHIEVLHLDGKPLLLQVRQLQLKVELGLVLRHVNFASLVHPRHHHSRRCHAGRECYEPRGSRRQNHTPRNEVLLRVRHVGQLLDYTCRELDDLLKRREYEFPDVLRELDNLILEFGPSAKDRRQRSRVGVRVLLLNRRDHRRLSLGNAQLLERYPRRRLGE